MDCGIDFKLPHCSRVPMQYERVLFMSREGGEGRGREERGAMIWLASRWRAHEAPRQGNTDAGPAR